MCRGDVCFDSRDVIVGVICNVHQNLSLTKDAITGKAEMKNHEISDSVGCTEEMFLRSWLGDTMGYKFSTAVGCEVTTSFSKVCLRMDQNSSRELTFFEICWTIMRRMLQEPPFSLSNDEAKRYTLHRCIQLR